MNIKTAGISQKKDNCLFCLQTQGKQTMGSFSSSEVVWDLLMWCTGMGEFTVGLFFSCGPDVHGFGLMVGPPENTSKQMLIRWRGVGSDAAYFLFSCRPVNIQID